MRSCVVHSTESLAEQPVSASVRSRTRRGDRRGQTEPGETSEPDRRILGGNSPLGGQDRFPTRLLSGIPTSSPDALDADAILAGQATPARQPGETVAIATTNLALLNRFPGINVQTWDKTRRASCAAERPIRPQSWRGTRHCFQAPSAENDRCATSPFFPGGSETIGERKPGIPTAVASHLFLRAESLCEQLQFRFMTDSRKRGPPNRIGFQRPDWQRGFFPIAPPLRN